MRRTDSATSKSETGQFGYMAQSEGLLEPLYFQPLEISLLANYFWGKILPSQKDSAGEQISEELIFLQHSGHFCLFSHPLTYLILKIVF